MTLHNLLNSPSSDILSSQAGLPPTAVTATTNHVYLHAETPHASCDVLISSPCPVACGLLACACLSSQQQTVCCFHEVCCSLTVTAACRRHESCLVDATPLLTLGIKFGVCYTCNFGSTLTFLSTWQLNIRVVHSSDAMRLFMAQDARSVAS